MNIKRIRILNELLTEEMNHWMIYPVILVNMGIARKMLGIGDPDLLLWSLCGLFPPVFFLIRCAAKHLIPFVFLHLAVAAAVIAASLMLPMLVIEKVICIVCVLGYALYSLVQRLKNNTLYTGAIQLPLAVGISALSALLQHYQGTKGWDNYYLFSLIAEIALYFIIYYVEHYLDFLAMNNSSAGFLPAREMFHSGMGLVLLYTTLGAVILLLGSQFEWVAGILEPIKALLLRFLRFLFSRRGSEEPEVELPAEEPVNTEMGGMPLPAGGEPHWIWKVLEFLLMAAFFVGILCAAIYLIRKFVQIVRKYMHLQFSERTTQAEEDAFDIREKCEIEKSSDKDRRSLFSALSPKERIRKLYKKRVLQSAEGKAEEDPGRLGLFTAKEWEEKLETDGMAEIYELARYSRREMTGAEVRKMKEACRQ